MKNIYTNIDVLSKALNASWKRNEVISNNIANANTPNYKKSKVVFEELLKDYMKNENFQTYITHENHIPIRNTDISTLNYRIETEKNTSTRRDGNNVDADVEMAELAKNTIMYNTLSTKVNGSFHKLKTIINEGR